MARNRKFRNAYQVTVEGVTTNGFSAKMMDELLENMVKAMNTAQVTATVKVLSTDGDYNAETKESTDEGN